MTTEKLLNLNYHYSYRIRESKNTVQVIVPNNMCTCSLFVRC